MSENKISGIIFWFFLLVLLSAYISGLFIDVTRDAGKYATIAKEIYENGNFINLTIHGEPYDQKPPLLFWLGAMGFAIGGTSNFWFKFPVLLLVFAGIYWGYRLGKSLYNRRVGQLTAFLMLTSFIYVLYSMDIHTDTPLQAFVTLALWQLYEFITTGRSRHYIIGFVAVGLAMLSKGPIGAIIPGFAVLGHIILKRNFRLLLDYRWYAGIFIALLIISPALAGLYNQFGTKGLYFFFWENMAGRITGSYIKAVNDPFFYVHNLMYQFMPWALLFFISAFMDFRKLILNKFKSGEYFTFTGIWIYFIVLNASTSQLPNYIFAIIPLMAVLTAKWIDISVSSAGRLYTVFYRTQNVVLVMLWIGIFVLAGYLFPGSKHIFTFGFIAGIIATIYLFFNAKHRVIRLLAPSFVAFSCLVFFMNLHVFPYIFSFQAPPSAAKYYSENRNGEDVLYNYHYDQYELFFYSQPEAKQLKMSELTKVAGTKGNWIFTDEKGFAQIRELNLKSDTVIAYRHLYLDRGGRFINPKTRDNVLMPMYLIKY